METKSEVTWDSELVGGAKRVRIYVNEGDSYGREAVDVAILGFLRKEGAAGATVFRAIQGFGASGVIHTAGFAEMTWRLPIVIEWIERADVVERLLPPIKQMVTHGLVTVDQVQVERYAPHPVRDVSAKLRVRDVMSTKVVSVAPDTAFHTIVELMLGKSYRAIPVVQSGVPVGMITNSDLIRRGGLSMRMQLLKALDAPALQAELERLGRVAKSAAELMNRELVTIPASASLRQAATLMSFRRLKRLPAVDERGLLLGMLSRLDVLRSAARGIERREGEPHEEEIGLAASASVGRIMRTDVPMVHPDAHIPEVVQAVVSTRLDRCLVVDGERHVLGKITDAEVLERVTPSLRPSALRSLMHRLPFVHAKPEEVATEQHAKARTAADLMVKTAIVPEQAPIREAIAAMLAGEHKIVAVVDDEERLVGVLDRADLLHGLVALDAAQT